MELRESLTIALDIIRTHKLRSFLTLLGVIIGMTSIVGMQSLIQGFQKNMKRDMEQLGSNVFQVQKYPMMQMGGPHHDRQYRNRKDLTMREADAIAEHCDLVTNVGPEVWRMGVIVKYKDKKTSPTVALAGGKTAFFANNGYFIKDGRAITETDVQDDRNVTVIGMDIVEELFPFQDPIGEDLIVDGHKYQIIGTLEEQGNSFGQSEDNRVVVPVTTYQKYYGNDESLNITVQVVDGVTMEDAQEQVASMLRIVRKVPPDQPNDFEIWSSESLIQSFNNITRTVRIGAIVIVSFALLVAGIGIMNIMLVSIRERTREIGIRMALGARRNDILFQFLVEAVLLSEIGGIVGIGLGVGIGQMLTLFKIPGSIPVGTIVIGFVFCSLVGLFFGIYPANKASKMDPIESLRYE
jgi:putative ABC transport system permease protein